MVIVIFSTEKDFFCRFGKLPFIGNLNFCVLLRTSTFATRIISDLPLLPFYFMQPYCSRVGLSLPSPQQQIQANCSSMGSSFSLPDKKYSIPHNSSTCGKNPTNKRARCKEFVISTFF